MSTTVNFTCTVDRDLLERAKLVAAKSDTSINALFNAQLRYLIETFESAEAGRNANYPTLLAFSLGQLTGNEVSHTLGIDSEEDLNLCAVLKCNSHIYPLYVSARTPTSRHSHLPALNLVLTMRNCTHTSKRCRHKTRCCKLTN